MHTIWEQTAMSGGLRSLRQGTEGQGLPQKLPPESCRPKGSKSGCVQFYHTCK